MGEVLGVGLLGCGTVGSEVLRILESNSGRIAERAGVQLEVRGIAVRDLDAERDVPMSRSVFTADPSGLVRREDLSIVVEVMGGIEPARGLIVDAMRSGKSVVSANKELIANHGRELFGAAEASGVDFFFEGAVAGGIPIIRPLKESLSGERIERVMGIVNGTTNYILTRMSDEGMEFGPALAEAERLGYAEMDPSADIDGDDAAAKLAILASIAFDRRVVSNDVHREGISQVKAVDIGYARTLGYVVKLLAIGELVDDEVAVRVHPTMIPQVHPLASVRDNLNAVFIEGPNIGELMFYGRGAGGAPTATAVIGDVVDAARNIAGGSRSIGCTCFGRDAMIRPIGAAETQYYMLIEVRDLPGVLAQVARCFADHDVSIKSLWQEGFGDEARLVLVTHRAPESNFASLLVELEQLEVVQEVSSALRVQSAEG